MFNVVLSPTAESPLTVILTQYPVESFVGSTPVDSTIPNFRFRVRKPHKKNESEVSYIIDSLLSKIFICQEKHVKYN